MPKPLPPAPPAGPELSLKVCGAPGIWRAGQALRLPLKRALALLAYLAWQGQAVPRRHLALLLWPDAGPAQGRTRLRRLVYSIEQALACPVLAADGDSLALQPGALAVDALAFAQFAQTAVAAAALDDAALQQAQHWLAQLRGAPMQDMGFGSDAFDDWAQAMAIEHQHLLARLLERVIDALAQRGEHASALALAERLLALDPYREPSHVLLMQLHALQGHRAGVEAAYARCAELLRAEFGIPPGPQTERAYLALSDALQAQPAQPAVPPPAGSPVRSPVRFAQSAFGTIAYTVLGTGDETVVVAPGFVCHVELALEHPPFGAFIGRLAQQHRVILFDRRGIGLSERLQATSTPAAMASDMRAILDHAGVASAWLFGSSEGGMGALQLAVDHPQRVRGLCLFGALARGSAAPDYPWALPAAAYDVWLQRIVASWGGPVGIETFAPSECQQPALRAWWARLVRQAASPGGLETVLAGLRDADLRDRLPRITQPTLVMHRRGDRAVRFDAGHHLAQAIAGARWLPLDGDDHFWWCGDQAPILQAITGFIAAHPARDAPRDAARDAQATPRA